MLAYTAITAVQRACKRHNFLRKSHCSVKIKLLKFINTKPSYILYINCIPLPFCIARHQTMNQLNTPAAGTCSPWY